MNTHLIASLVTLNAITFVAVAEFVRRMRKGRH